MSFLLHNVLLLDARSPFHRKRINITIQSGVITSLEIAGNQLNTDLPVIDLTGQCASIGWIDMRALIPEPGFEYKENIENGAKVAMNGGFTDVVLLPNTLPARQTKQDIAFLKQHPAQHIVAMHPVAGVTVDAKGQDLTDMIDLHHAGAVAFSDGAVPIGHTGIVLKTLQYLQPLNGLLIQRPDDKLLTQYGVMHEGVQSTMLGLKGMPPLAETLIIQRDLQLLEYAGGRLHFSLISCKESVDLIRKAKKQGLAVTCDVAVHQLFFDDSSMQDFDSFYKVNPPFRTQDHIKALWEGLADDTIDVIVSDHTPQDEESKNLELDMADFGTIGWETFFAVLCTANERLERPMEIDRLLYKFTVAPREILQLDLPAVEVGKAVCMTCFDLEATCLPTPKNSLSTSKNSPFWGMPLKGRATGVCKGDTFINIS